MVYEDLHILLFNEAIPVQVTPGIISAPRPQGDRGKDDHQTHEEKANRGRAKPPHHQPPLHACNSTLDKGDPLLPDFIMQKRLHKSSKCML
jgi:hypothetical protein